MSNPTEGQDKIDRILAEYQIGFVVGDKDIDQHLASFKQALTTLIAKEITTHTNAEIAKVLDRLIAQQWSFGEEVDALAVPTRYIQAERDKLKEVK